MASDEAWMELKIRPVFAQSQRIEHGGLADLTVPQRQQLKRVKRQCFTGSVEIRDDDRAANRGTLFILPSHSRKIRCEWISLDM